MEKTNTTPTADEDFDAAFAEAIVAADTDAGTPKVVVEDPVVTAEPTTKPEEKKEIKPEEKKEVVADPAATVPAADDPEKAAAEAKAKEEAKAADDLRASVTARVTAEAEALAKARLEAEEKEKAAAKVKEETKPVEIKDPELTEDDKKALALLEKEWPDIAEAVKRQLAHATGVIEARFSRALTSVTGQIYEHMAPMADGLQAVAGRTHRESVLAAHPDFDAYAPKLEGWIATQPAYLAKAYKDVYTGGNSQEVNDLMTRYKEANGVKSETPPAQKPADKPVDKKAAEKAAALAPVVARRSTPTPSGDDPEDFDGAFALAAAEYEPKK